MFLGTQEVTAYQFNTNGYNIILVDTPGFNDTYKSDTEILLDLAKWLEVTYRQNAKLTGIIYLHRITDVRMDGSAMRNLKMFRKLCGDQPMKNVVIASTFWGAIEDDKAVAHEAELMGKDDFWGDMISHGAQVKRFAGTKQSALDILMSFASKATVTLDIQRELVDEDKPLGETAAGNAVNEELHRLEAKYLAELGRIQQETAAALAEKDVQYENILKKERERMEQKLNRLHNDQELLRQERREEIRRIETENQRRFSLLKKEYDSKLEKQQLEAERIRQGDSAAFRDQLREMSTQNAVFSAGFHREIRDLQNSTEDQVRGLQSENEALRASAASASSGSAGGNVGSKFLNLVAVGTMAAFDPVAIPIALASLADFVSEF